MHLFPINQGHFQEAIYSGVEMRTFPICLGLWKPIGQREVWPSCSASELTAPFIPPPTTTLQKSLGQRLDSFRGGEEERERGGEGRVWRGRLHLHSWPIHEQSRGGTRSVCGRQHYCASLCVLQNTRRVHPHGPPWTREPGSHSTAPERRHWGKKINIRYLIPCPNLTLPVLCSG